MVEADIANPAFLAVAIPAVLIAGISKGGFGSGGAFAATPLLALAIDPVLAVGLMLPLLMIMDVTGLPAYWRKWDRANARALMAGAVPGIALGALFFAVTSVAAVRLLIGLIALSFVLFRAVTAAGWRPSGAPRFRWGRAAAWGAAAGFTSFVSHAGGPPAAIQLLGQRLEKTAYQATTVIVFWWINLVKAPVYWGMGIFEGALGATLWLAPVAVAGMLLGVWAHKRIDDRWFFLLIHAFLLITGVKLTWDGAAALL